MTIKNKIDFWVGIVMTGIAALFFALMPSQIGSVKNTWGVRQTLPLGQRLFPVMSLSMVAVCGIILAIVSISTAPKKPYVKRPNEDIKGAVITALAWLLYALGAQYLGYYVSTLIVVFFLLRFYGVKNWIILASITVGMTVFVYVIFGLIMKLPFPSRVLLI